jgi:hypothetical protein
MLTDRPATCAPGAVGATPAAAAIAVTAPTAISADILAAIAAHQVEIAAIDARAKKLRTTHSV